MYFRYHFSSAIIGTAWNRETNYGKSNIFMILRFSIYEHGIFLPLFTYALLPLIKIFLTWFLHFLSFSPVVAPECFWERDAAICSFRVLATTEPKSPSISHSALLPPLTMPVMPGHTMRVHILVYVTPFAFSALCSLPILVNTYSFTSM